MTRSKSSVLRPGCWYADTRGGHLASFLRFEGYSPDKKLLFFGYMTGHPSSYPLIDNHYVFRADLDIEWFLPNDEDVIKWALD